MSMAFRYPRMQLQRNPIAAFIEALNMIGDYMNSRYVALLEVRSRKTTVSTMVLDLLIAGHYKQLGDI
jgi:hypothetical protein